MGGRPGDDEGSIMVLRDSNGLLATNSSLSMSTSKVSRESSDTTRASVVLCAAKKQREATARWISVVVLVVFSSGVTVALALPLLPFFLRDSYTTRHLNSVRIHAMSGSTVIIYAPSATASTGVLLPSKRVHGRGLWDTGYL